MIISKLLGSCQQLLVRGQGHNLAMRMSVSSAATINQEEDAFNFIQSFDVSQYKAQYGMPQECWVESLAATNAKKLRLKSLHQDVFAVYPRLDFIHANVKWQRTYNKLNWNHVKNVKEMIHWHGGGAKPWQQKGTGRARHGSTRSPQWVQGGKVFGPKAPKSLYYMLDWDLRVHGLTHTLTIKFIQDDVHVVDNLDIPTDDPSHILDLIEARGWGKSTLFVDSTDTFPYNITAATEEIDHVNVMPTYGLNPVSMLKHETLVLTESAVDEITTKLLFALSRTDKAKIRVQSMVGPTEMTLNLEKHRPVV